MLDNYSLPESYFPNPWFSETESHSVYQAGFEFLIRLLPEGWSCRHVLPCPAGLS